MSGSQRTSLFQRLKLGQKFTLLLAVAFIGGTVVSGLILGQVLQKRAENDVVSQGELLADFENAVRGYTSDELTPLLMNSAGNPNGFVIETVPTFAAKQVFGLLHQDPAYESYQYKAATINPTNKNDLADTQEAGFVTLFRQQPDLSEISGYRTLAGQTVFYSARPLKVSSESCLACHTDAAHAPPAMVAQFGSDGGFGWKLNDTVGAQVVYVPASEILDAAHRSFAIVMGIFVLMFALVIVLINMLLRRSVVWPIHKMSNLAAQISEGEMASEAAALSIADLEPVAARGDELGQSARVLQQMAREVLAREERLAREVQQLRIEIDQVKKEREVREITDSEFFRDLQNKAQRLRRTSPESGSE